MKNILGKIIIIPIVCSFTIGLNSCATSNNLNISLWGEEYKKLQSSIFSIADIDILFKSFRNFEQSTKKEINFSSSVPLKYKNFVYNYTIDEDSFFKVSNFDLRLVSLHNKESNARFKVENTFDSYVKNLKAPAKPYFDVINSQYYTLIKDNILYEQTTNYSFSRLIGALGLKEYFYIPNNLRLSGYKYSNFDNFRLYSYFAKETIKTLSSQDEYYLHSILSESSKKYFSNNLIVYEINTSSFLTALFSFFDYTKSVNSLDELYTKYNTYFEALSNQTHKYLVFIQNGVLTSIDMSISGILKNDPILKTSLHPNIDINFRVNFNTGDTVGFAYGSLSAFIDSEKEYPLKDDFLVSII